MSPDFRRPTIALLLALAIAPLGGTAHAQRPAFLDQALAVEIEADSAELSEERGVSVYRGNVILSRGPLKMHGDILEIRRDQKDGRIEATLSGKPARAIHSTENEPVIATANKIIYTTVAEILQLMGNALISRGGDKLSGQQVRYDVTNARIQAEGGNERVHILLTPPEETGKPR